MPNPEDLPVLAITMGDVNGIGPEILAKALARPEPWAGSFPIVIGSVAAYEEARSFAPGAPPAVPVKSAFEARALRGHVGIMDAGAPGPVARPGMLDPEAGRASIVWCNKAVRLVLDGDAAALVTCPINKSAIHAAGCAHIGHTELIAEMSGATDYRMCLFAGPMRILHNTGHLPLREALDFVRRDRIIDSIRIAHEALLRLGLGAPRIAVAGLNPHAGEAGLLGQEELDEIAPAIEAARAYGIQCTGPYPPDTIMGRMRAGEFDMLIAMYHDQGHIPLKLIAMDEGVNVTLGTPVIRTSVDHGTAFDIAGRGIAREHSLCAAIQLAALLSAHNVRSASSAA